MKKSFFGPEGLTSTSANHYANLAKEEGRTKASYLANVQFYSEAVRVIGTQDGGIIRDGSKPDDLAKVEKAIGEVAQLNSLIAFFREAIKEKDRLGVEAANWKDESARADFDERYKNCKKPVKGAYLTEDDVKGGWSIGEQEKYLSLEAEAAALGKYIHEDGCISKARVALMDKLMNPKSVKEAGRDTIIYDYIPTVSADDVDKLFFRLQARHREVQAELNGMKKRVQDALDANKLQVDEEYRAALAKWNAQEQAFDREQQQIVAAESVERKRLQQEVAALKIVVPNRLKEVFEMLKETSK